MCRNIRTLYNFDPPVTDDEIYAASLQYVRKISGFTKPSKLNDEVFEDAIQRIAAVSRELMQGLVTQAPKKDRDVEKARAKERTEKRFGPRQPTPSA
jgi:hypothetical protein